MKDTTLALIAPLLELLRSHHSLRELRPAVFYVNNRNFLHFHEEGDGVCADVRLARAFVRMPVSTEAEQLELLSRIDECLTTLDSHKDRRSRRDRDFPLRRRQ